MKKEKSKKLNIIDLYSGAGGLSLGAARAGFNISGAVELDSKAIETHILNFPNSNHLQSDISKLNGNMILDQLDLHKVEIAGIIGGPPCQGFSTIGKRSLEDSRNSLFAKFFEIVNEIKPSFFVAENVLGIMNEKFDKIRENAFLNVKDYEMLPPLIIKASDYGVPTIRTRVFFIGYLSKKISRLSLEEFYEKKVNEENQTKVKDALIGLPKELNIENKEGNEHLEELFFEKIKSKESFFHSRVCGVIPEGIGSQIHIIDYFENLIITGCKATKHSKEVAERYSELNFGKQDIVSKSQRLDPNGFCPTLRAGTGSDKGSFQAVRPIHYDFPRVITVREAARLQGFPDWFIFHPTIWHSFRQIGNSVSPIVAEKVLSTIYQKLI